MSICSRLTLSADSADQLVGAYDWLVSDEAKAGYWERNISAMLLDEAESVSLTVKAVGDEALRISTNYKPQFLEADGRLLIDDRDPRFNYLNYEGSAMPGVVLGWANRVFDRHAPGPNLRVTARPLSIDTRVSLEVELENGQAAEAALEAHLDRNGVAEWLLVASVAENPHLYWRTSRVNALGTRCQVVAHLRRLVSEFRQMHGTIHRAFVDGQAV
ncbi:MAG: hypothetical protein AB7Q00_12675 [Phycisphaerales bacterium]